ncbi:MAG: tetratricopeptide repeat protein [Saprospiraceae bacterium]|nr:tetratricopeptide repeat protein [Saprospiraceae bacterium]
MKYIVLFLLLPFLAFSQIKPALPAGRGVSPILNSHNGSSGNTYAVVVGISDYQDPAIPDLRYADKDAEAFANYLRSPAGGSLDKDHLRLLTNSNATAGKVASALYWLVDESKEADQVIIYFSGHGDVERKFIGQPGFLLCWDSPFNVYMAGGSIELGMLQAVISTLTIEKKARVLMISDACHSGKLAGSNINGSQITNANLARQFGNEIKILSCQSNEYSLEGNQWGGGRGVFSYHLVNGLYGLANHNNDDKLNLKEISRYLEDYIPKEAAPEKQNPVIVGDKETNVSKIFPELLVTLSQNISREMPSFLPTENRGLEEDVLAGLDTNSRKIYFLFKKSLESKTFFEPANACADYYYEKLSKDDRLSRLHNSMRRNYAAALQDDAQQVITKLLKSDISEVMRISIQKYKFYPHYLEKASQLLGVEHYMYPVLQCRKEFFEGYLLARTFSKLSPAKSRMALSHYRNALQWQADFPLAKLMMGELFRYKLIALDSALFYTKSALEFNPTWLVACTNLASLYLIEFRDFEKSKLYLEQARNIDSSSALVPFYWGFYLNWLNKLAEAEQQFKNAIHLDSTFFSARLNLGGLYTNTNRYSEAEQEFLKCIQIDSSISSSFISLGYLYKVSGRYAEAEQEFKKAIQVDSTEYFPYRYLGEICKVAGRYAEGQFKKGVQVDSNNARAYYYLGKFYQDTLRFTEAEQQFNKAIQLDSSCSGCYSALANIYKDTRRYTEAEQQFNKAIQLDSSCAMCYFAMANIYKNTRRFSEAELYYKNSIQRGNKNALRYLGDLYLETKRTEEAKMSYEELLIESAKAPNSLLGMAIVYSRKGDIPKAFEYLQKSLEAGFTNIKRLEEDTDFSPLRDLPEWNALMKKYFPNMMKN